MLLSDLIHLPVLDADGHRLGTVVDVRLAAPPDDHQQVPTHVWGFVVSPGTQSSYLGYERSGVNSPWALATLLRWRHRGTFLAAWDDVARVATDAITLRPGYTRYSASLKHT
jgi:sporulation protein YlmC with PRC-barrel domain